METHSPLAILHSLIVASLAADRKWSLSSQTARALTQSVCPWYVLKHDWPFHILIVLSADPVSNSASLAGDDESTTSTVQMAAAWPERVATREPSYRHTLASLSQEPLKRNSILAARAHTNDKEKAQFNSKQFDVYV